MLFKQCVSDTYIHLNSDNFYVLLLKVAFNQQRTPDKNNFTWWLLIAHIGRSKTFGLLLSNVIENSKVHVFEICSPFAILCNNRKIAHTNK